MQKIEPMSIGQLNQWALANCQGNTRKNAMEG